MRYIILLIATFVAGGLFLGGVLHKSAPRPDRTHFCPTLQLPMVIDRTFSGPGMDRHRSIYEYQKDVRLMATRCNLKNL